jgi:hypothetical protein
MPAGVQPRRAADTPLPHGVECDAWPAGTCGSDCVTQLKNFGGVLSAPFPGTQCPLVNSDATWSSTDW